MFLDIIVYTLFAASLAAILYAFHVFIQLIRLKKNIKKNWSYLDIQFHHRHVLCDQLIEKTLYVPDVQIYINPIEELKREASALNKKVEVTGGAKSPFFKQLVKKEEKLKESLELFIELFSQAPESTTKQELKTVVRNICSTFEKEETFKSRYNFSTKRLMLYQSRFPAKSISQKIRMHHFVEIP
ncbi:MAG: hypothetical protein GWP59_03535 [Chlamydiales bacterium]|nr:hypothetical protein [Chlamydiales bacterium]NCF70756.1 hypothetical protein [Chlamydiales bacterium]